MKLTGHKIDATMLASVSSNNCSSNGTYTHLVELVDKHLPGAYRGSAIHSQVAVVLLLHKPLQYVQHLTALREQQHLTALLVPHL